MHGLGLAAALFAAFWWLCCKLPEPPREKPPQRPRGPAPGSVEITFHKPPAPRKAAYKPKPDRQLVFAAADSCLALAAALERKAATEPDEVKRTRYIAQAAAQRLKAEKIAIQAE